MARGNTAVIPGFILIAFGILLVLNYQIGPIQFSPNCPSYGIATEFINPNTGTVNQVLNVGGLTYCMSSTTVYWWQVINGNTVQSGSTQLVPSIQPHYNGAAYSFGISAPNVGTYTVYVSMCPQGDPTTACAYYSAVIRSSQMVIKNNTPPVYSLTVNFIQNGNGAAGVFAELYLNSNLISYQVSNSAGTVIFAGLPTNTYQIFYVYNGYNGQGTTFNVQSNTVGTITIQSFSDTATIQFTQNGNPLPGVSASLSNTGYGTKVSDPSGHVAFPGLADGTIYTLVYAYGGCAYTDQFAPNNINYQITLSVPTSCSTTTTTTTGGTTTTTGGTTTNTTRTNIDIILNLEGLNILGIPLGYFFIGTGVVVLLAGTRKR